MLTRRHLLRAFTIATGLAVTALPALADKVAVTDIVGRKVEVDAPVKRIILGEGRQMYFVGALDREEPFKRVVGWRDDLGKADPETFRAYAKRYPEIAKLPGVFTTAEQWKTQAINIDPKLRAEKTALWRKWFAENIMAR